MGIVGANSTAGREVKFIDPSKTTKSESSWLGYTLCDYIYFYALKVYAFHTHTHTHCIKFFSRAYNVCIPLYNEERRLGDQRGSDTLVVPLITSNDGLSIAFFIKLQISSAYKITWLELVFLYARLIIFVRSRWTFRLYFLRVSICYSLKHKNALRALDFRSFALNSGEM